MKKITWNIVAVIVGVVSAIGTEQAAIYFGFVHPMMMVHRYTAMVIGFLITFWPIMLALNSTKRDS